MNNLPETNNCILKLENGWLTICFNRPEKRNALSEGLLLDIKFTLESVESDRSIRGILFRGTGGVFCAGADLEDLKKIATSGVNARDLAVEMSIQAGSIF